jgi:hypothetical protein
MEKSSKLQENSKPTTILRQGGKNARTGSHMESINACVVAVIMAWDSGRVRLWSDYRSDRRSRGGIVGRQRTRRRLFNSVSGPVVGIVWATFVVRMALRKKYAGFRIALIPTAEN